MKGAGGGGGPSLQNPLVLQTLHQYPGQPSLRNGPQPGSGMTTEASLGTRTYSPSPMSACGYSDSVGLDLAQDYAVNKILK